MTAQARIEGPNDNKGDTMRYKVTENHAPRIARGEADYNVAEFLRLADAQWYAENAGTGFTRKVEVWERVVVETEKPA